MMIPPIDDDDDIRSNIEVEEELELKDADFSHS